MTTTYTSADELPPGEWAIVELFGHSTLVGRIGEVERFGTKMLAIEPLFNSSLLGPVYHGGGSIYRLTPCPAQIAWDKQPRQAWLLPDAVRVTLPPALLPAPEIEIEDEEHDRDPEDHDPDAGKYVEIF